MNSKLEQDAKTYYESFAKEYEDTLITQRSRMAVKNTLDLMTRDRIDWGILIYGAGHIPSVREALKENKVSFLILELAEPK